MYLAAATSLLPDMNRSDKRLLVYTAGLWLVGFLGVGGSFVR
jgi:hypothetical protein